MKAVSRKILAANAGRDPQRLRLKCALLRRSAFAFFRGTNPLFLGLLPAGRAVFHAPQVLVCGDLHLENFGTYKGDNRLCYFDINDFDDACLAPCSIDIVRFLSSINLAAVELKIGAKQTALLKRSFLDGYRAGVREGKPRWIERSLADGPVRSVLRRAMRRSRLKLLNRFTSLRRKQRNFNIDGVHTIRLKDRYRKALRRLLDNLGEKTGRTGFFRMIDAARRIAGDGSLGLPRYVMLVAGRGTANGNFLLDLKFAAPSAVAKWCKQRQPQWQDDAHRVVTLQRIVQAIPPAMLDAVRFDASPYVLKEMQPLIDRLDLAAYRTKPRRLARAVQTMGNVTGWAHLRGCGRLGAASIESLQAFAAEPTWQRACEKAADGASDKLLAAWRDFCADYDAGEITAAIKAK
jgi:uncharacterized protein (DUF2252 family)